MSFMSSDLMSCDRSSCEVAPSGGAASRSVRAWSAKRLGGSTRSAPIGVTCDGTPSTGVRRRAVVGAWNASRPRLVSSVAVGKFSWVRVAYSGSASRSRWPAYSTSGCEGGSSSAAISEGSLAKGSSALAAPAVSSCAGRGAAHSASPVDVAGSGRFVRNHIEGDRGGHRRGVPGRRRRRLRRGV